MTDAQKELVGNYQTLLDAEAKLAQLKKDAEKPSSAGAARKASVRMPTARYRRRRCGAVADGHVHDLLLGAALVGQEAQGVTQQNKPSASGRGLLPHR